MIKPGIAAKDLVESMTYFFISGMEIATYNDKISITHPFKTDFSAFISADSFFNIMSRSSIDKFTLTRANENVAVNAKGLNVSLPVVVDNEVAGRIATVSKSLKGAKWFVLPDNFCENITLCAFAASKSESESTLSCVRIDGTTCIASDNNRIAIATMDKKMHPLFLKATEIKNLISIEPILYSASSAWLHFKSKQGCIFSIRRIKGEYPDFAKHFDFDGTKVELPQNLTEGTDLASIFISNTEQPSINVNIQKGKCILNVDAESGKLSFKTAIDYQGEPLKFTINPDFLLEMMKYSTSVVLAEGKAKLETENFSLLTSLYEE